MDGGDEQMDVLDHGYVKYITHMGSDEDIIEAARMSTGKGFISWDPYWRCKKCGKVELPHMTGDDWVACSEAQQACDFEKFPRGDIGLLDTLWRNKHTSPFEMCEVVFEVQAPLFVLREWQRHRTQSYNEFSARYAQMPDLHYVPDASRIKKQHTTNKQASGGEVDADIAAAFIDECEVDQERLYIQYEDWLEQGVAKEIARINTPVSRYSKMRVKANLLNWFRFMNLRLRPNAQHEIRVFAQAIEEILSIHFPRSVRLFKEYDLYAASFGQEELIILREFLAKNASALKTFLETGTGATAQDRLGKTRFEEFKKKLTVGGLEIL